MLLLKKLEGGGLKLDATPIERFLKSRIEGTLGMELKITLNLNVLKNQYFEKSLRKTKCHKILNLKARYHNLSYCAILYSA